MEMDCEISLNDLPYEVWIASREADLQDFSLTKENIQDLLNIQQMIYLYENKDLTLNEVLARVLTFYLKFVPYKKR